MVAKEWQIPAPVLAYGLEYLGWSQWFVWACEILSMEHDEMEVRRRRAENQARRRGR